MSLRDKIFSFDGRLRRRDYWVISIGIGVGVFFATHLLYLVLFGPAYSVLTSGFAAVGAIRTEPRIEWIGMVVSLLIAWPTFALAAKRAHDRGRSARVVITLLALLQVFDLMSPLMGRGQSSLLLFYFVALIAMLGALIYLFVVVGCLDGTPGPNRYGPSPKGLEGGGDLASTFD